MRRVCAGAELEIVFDEHSQSFGYAQPDRNYELIELSPEPSWRRVAYRRERSEIVLEGTREEDLTAATVWKEYEFKCKPGDPRRRPCLMSPYHYRLDWLMWFAAMGTPDEYPWTLHLVGKLLRGDRDTLSLIAENPFPDAPPRWVRASLYRYRFAPSGTGVWWTREWVRPWLPPLRADDPQFLGLLEAYGWKENRQNQ